MAPSGAEKVQRKISSQEQPEAENGRKILILEALSMVLQSVSGGGILKTPDRLYGLEPGCQRSLFIHCRSH